MKLKQMILTTAATMLLATPSWAEILVTNPHSFETAKGMSVGVALMAFENTGDTPDKLVGVSSPVCETAELHEMKEENGIMKMRRVAGTGDGQAGGGGIDIPEHQQVALTPDSYHIMLMGLKKTLNVGDTFPMTLHFVSGETKQISVPVLSRMEKMKEMGDHMNHMKHDKMEGMSPEMHHEMNHEMMMEEKMDDAMDHPEHD